ncbi:MULTISPECIES: NAD(P)-dependent oxidoreductase [unclassified Pseudomonas]|uniref:NAD(P)-dependent oxidoreductase n=1 Tax=unclassified Pseudomonas TaxID=196821 RepID=UPI000BD526D1|nr:MULTISPECIES: NAD(P)-dependent oxidoreductase [unclassified Pseudomonas]PVZ20135.1 3-hydroxyisobutyrate dehydrogenase [Pseudomonas sp. URIL14HWK12:I12]PVZ27201.1 3-hydroxyisobutyrate dehydrogenase [Pseudomonas sp. URIL14HWK12:I10]PVZ38090.1 3-hydroxyisobutyrate dehydrogenase [Pseudomonas sp. URIL14HWK12:I11]SNZ04590.1 3-hydroxyisobutyrate dehydrogenase [Pseudomonas sp. URIL14HWK12:I9]
MAITVGIIGLGNMGGGMAATLASKGFDVRGFDPAPAAREAAASKGVKTSADRAQVIGAAQVLILSLPKAEHVQAVCLGEQGVLSVGQPGLVVVDTTTSTAAMSREVAQALAGRGIGFLDAPVSGGPKGAASGTMSMVLGGTAEHLATAQPVLEAMSGTRVHVGDTGAGNVAKIANNLLAAAHLISTAEALSLAAKAGVPPERLLEGINAGSGRSAASQVMFPTWVLNKAYDSGFSMALMRKDVGLAQALAEELGADLPLARLVGELWRDSAQTLPDGKDFCCIAQRTDAALFGDQ